AGIGRLFISALGAYDTPMIVGLTVMFAYILAITVFFLDIIYALVDPRVRVGGDHLSLRGSSGKNESRWKFWRRNLSRSSERRNLTAVSAPHPQNQHTRRFHAADFTGFLKRQTAGAVGLMRQLAEYPSAVAGLI